MYEELARMIYDYVKRKSPSIGVFEGRGRRAPVALQKGFADATEVEIHWTPPSMRADAKVSVGWRFTPGETCRQVRTLGPGFSLTINVFQAGGGRFSANSVGWTGVALAQAVANGGWPYVAFCSTPWRYDQKTKKTIEDLFQFVARHEEYYEDLESAAQVALMWSEKNMFPRPGRRHDRESFLSHHRGWYNALVKSHVEFDILDDYQLDFGEKTSLISTTW